MYTVKRFFCALIALCVAMGGTSLAEIANDGKPETFTAYTHNGLVTFIDGACTDESIDSFEDATRVVDGVLDQLGGDEDTQLDAWRILTDAFGNRYYVFRQFYNDTTVLGGAVKVITDATGRMIGLTSSIEDNPTEERTTGGITAGEAEKIVLAEAFERRQQELNLISEFTDIIILPIALSIDLEEDDEEGSRYVWVVYTENPDSKLERSSDLPYLAHYVTLTGEYLYSLPTIMPGDEAGASGFDASYVFEFMEPVDYTGYVDLSTGGELEVSVTVMRDKRTGMYYLGNLERRIVVADCWEFLYGDSRVVLESSPDNLEWDQVGLLSLYNYCRAYDYYREIGWIGGDGLGTPIMVLNNYCDINHVPVDNAAYVGCYLGWQLFLASQGNDLSQCLDVLAHEFTHSVTDSVMTYSAYMNDFGAINEAMSDIQGKTCQMLMEGRENTSWMIGDRSLVDVRSMDEPHRGNQPEFTWDIYYMPNVKTPTPLNDEGGVHDNSSLLNSLAYRLYEDGGMTLEEGRAFWFTVDCAMVPGTDYAQLAELLPWALRAAGLEAYDTELARALDATRLGDKEVPNVFDDDRALLTLSLPENEVFDDEQWIMDLLCLDVDKLFSNVMDIFGSVMMGDYSVLPPSVQEVLNAPDGDAGELAELLDELLAGEEDSFDRVAELKKELMEWVKDRLGDVFYLANTNAGQDGRTMRMVTIPGYSVPMLFHGVYNQVTDAIDDGCMLIYIAGAWVDMSTLTDELERLNEEVSEDELSAEMEAYLEQLVVELMSVGSVEDVLKLAFYYIEGGEANELPATGLEEAHLVRNDMLNDLLKDMKDTQMTQPRKSRPKLDADLDETAEVGEDAASEEAAEETSDSADAEAPGDALPDAPEAVEDEATGETPEEATDDTAQAA